MQTTDLSAWSKWMLFFLFFLHLNNLITLTVNEDHRDEGTIWDRACFTEYSEYCTFWIFFCLLNNGLFFISQIFEVKTAVMHETDSIYAGQTTVCLLTTISHCFNDNVGVAVCCYSEFVYWTSFKWPKYNLGVQTLLLPNQFLMQ